MKLGAMGITLGKKKLKNGRVSLYLSYCFDRNRTKEYLGIILEPPATAAARERNREKMDLARGILADRQLGLISGHFRIEMLRGAASQVHDFFLLFDEFVTLYRGKDIHTVEAVQSYLHRFVKSTFLSLDSVTSLFCKQFYNYLAEELRGSTPVSYFRKFKECLAMCVERELLRKNPAANVRLVACDEFTKDVLTPDEVVRLARTPCPNAEIKRAFLFACNTGLRWCDIVALTGRSVDLPNRMLHLIQCKVEGRSRKAVLHLTLNNTAVRLLKMKALPSSDISLFQLPSYSYSLRVLRLWVKASGIPKHITFHCGRHSFITNIMRNGASIKTAAELAGHSTVRHTEKYIHIVDEQKRRAVESLPDLPLDWFG